MYNRPMLRYIFLAILVFAASGCAINEAYNPVAAGTSGTFELNASALKQITLGMTQPQVHQIMGETIIIGYNYQDSGHGASVPLTLKNPYKTSESEDAKGKCTVEYYATRVVIPDGVVSDQELMPLKFCQGVLIAKGWDKIK